VLVLNLKALELYFYQTQVIAKNNKLISWMGNKKRMWIVHNSIKFDLAILQKIFAELPKTIVSCLKFYADTKIKNCKALSQTKTKLFI